MCAPGVQSGSAAPSGRDSVIATTSCATCSASRTTRSTSNSRTTVCVTVMEHLRLNRSDPNDMWSARLAQPLTTSEKGPPPVGARALRRSSRSVQLARRPTGNFLIPLTKFDRTRVTSPPSSMLGDPRQQLLEHQPDLHPGQAVAQAQVRTALAEGQVVDVGTGHVDARRGRRTGTRPGCRRRTTSRPCRPRGSSCRASRRRGSPYDGSGRRARPSAAAPRARRDQRRVLLQLACSWSRCRAGRAWSC